MLTNRRYAFRGQQRSPLIVQFDTLGIVSCFAIETLFSRRAVIPIFDFKKCRNLEIRSLKVIERGTIRYIAYDLLLVFLCDKQDEGLSDMITSRRRRQVFWCVVTVARAMHPM